MNPEHPSLSPFVCLYVVARYWREIAAGCRRGWRGTKTYWVTCRVLVRYSDSDPWRELDADYLRGLVTQ